MVALVTLTSVTAQVLVAVPTLGERPSFLRETLKSIRQQGVAVDVVIIGPLHRIEAVAQEFTAEVVPDPGSLPAAINAGLSTAQPHHIFVTWLNDDDLLTPGSLQQTTAVLNEQSTSVLAYGACEYIDEHDHLLWTSKAGKWAERILAWGPDLIPQPGMLVRKTAWDAVGGVDESLRFAFDLDLLLRLKQHGSFVDVGSVVSRFRWHAASLTVGDRTTSLNESEAVKRRYLSPGARRMSWLWEKPVRGATRIAAARVSSRARKISASQH